MEYSNNDVEWKVASPRFAADRQQWLVPGRIRSPAARVHAAGSGAWRLDDLGEIYGSLAARISRYQRCHGRARRGRVIMHTIDGLDGVSGADRGVGLVHRAVGTLPYTHTALGR